MRCVNQKSKFSELYEPPKLFFTKEESHEESGVPLFIVKKQLKTLPRLALGVYFTPSGYHAPRRRIAAGRKIYVQLSFGFSLRNEFSLHKITQASIH